MLKVMHHYIDDERTPWMVNVIKTDKDGKKEKEPFYFESIRDAETFVYENLGDLTCKSCESSTFVKATDKDLRSSLQVAEFVDQNFKVKMKIRRIYRPDMYQTR